MKSKYKIVLVTSILLFSLSLLISFINYIKSLENTKKQLIEISLPLSVKNIYSEVQKNIIEPNLISSMMANDTFVKEWLLSGESDEERIKNYLNLIKNRYALLNTFLVSDKTKNYYTHDGALYKVDENDEKDAWYFKFKKMNSNNELNLDYNTHIDDTIIIFINYKIYDKDDYLATTGVAIKTSYILDMLKSFRNKYNFKVYFVNKNGEIVISENKFAHIENEEEKQEMKAIKNDILLHDGEIKFTKDRDDYILNSEYIKELDLYLVVEAKIDNFLYDVKNTFYMNLFFSISLTIFIIFIILSMNKNYRKELEFLASNDPLTKLPNRRSFTQSFEKIFSQFQRDKRDYSLIYFDIDNFKMINDKFGHLVGDKILIRVGEILDQNIRKSDYISRWGGEEFTILCSDTNIDKAKIIAEKIRVCLENDKKLKLFTKNKLTASFGITKFNEDDNYDTIISRVDDALYSAKKSGKNQIAIL